MKRSMTTIALVVATLALATPTFAQNLIVNPSFESGGATPDAWTTTGNAGRQQGPIPAGNPNFAVGYTDGVAAVNLGGGNEAHDGLLSQSFATVIGQAYRLTFDYGKYGEDANTITQSVNVSVTGLVAGDALNVDIDDITGTPFDISGNPAQSFSAYSYTFTATSTLSTLSFDDTTTVVADFSDGALDNVSITANAVAVPESGTITLVASALGMLGIVAARRKK